MVGVAISVVERLLQKILNQYRFCFRSGRKLGVLVTRDVGQCPYLTSQFALEVINAVYFLEAKNDRISVAFIDQANPSTVVIIPRCQVNSYLVCKIVRWQLDASDCADESARQSERVFWRRDAHLFLHKRCNRRASMLEARLSRQPIQPSELIGCQLGCDAMLSTHGLAREA